MIVNMKILADEEKFSMVQSCGIPSSSVSSIVMETNTIVNDTKY